MRAAKRKHVGEGEVLSAYELQRQSKMAVNAARLQEIFAQEDAQSSSSRGPKNAGIEGYALI